MVRKAWVMFGLFVMMCGLMIWSAGITEDQSNVKLIQPVVEAELSGVTEPKLPESSERTEKNGEASGGSEESPSLDKSTSSWVTILEMDDPVGDDNGPGTYLYPTHYQFAPYQGLLDITNLKIEGTGERIRFQVRFGELTNPWNGPLGFSHHLIQIYIDHRPGGGTAPLIPGAKVVFSPKASWDTLLKITGWGVYFFDSSDQLKRDIEPYQDAEVQILADGKTIQIELPIVEWTHFEDLYNGSYYLLVGAQDGFGPDNYRQVKEEVSEWYFGGGDPSGYSSNVIDLITPSGKSQKKILGSFDSNTRILAVVEPVHRPNPVRKGIIYLISLGIGLTIWFLWRKRDGITRSQ